MIILPPEVKPAADDGLDEDPPGCPATLFVVQIRFLWCARSGSDQLDVREGDRMVVVGTW